MPELPRLEGDEELNRTERRRRETHHSLLEATLRLLIDEGVAGFSVTDVVDRADVAGGTFYNHFGDRDEAIREVVGRIVADNSARVAELAGDDPLDGFIATWLVNAHRSMTDLDFARMVDNVIHSHIWPMADAPPPALVQLQRARAMGRVRCTENEVEVCYLLVAGLASGHAKAALAGVAADLSELSGPVVATMASVLGADEQALTETVDRMMPALLGVDA